MKPSRFLSIPGLMAPLGTLLFASGAGLSLIAVRALCTGNWRQLYLVGNLALAWLPLLFSLVACGVSQGGSIRDWRFCSSAFAWLLFFPNAPYIFTDLIHLHGWSRSHYWVDLVLILLFALTGFLLGFVSLYLMQSVVTRWLGKAAGWIFVPVVAALSGLGVCMGRFLRWNSWDIVVNPVGIFLDLFTRAADVFVKPERLVLPALFSLFLLLAYLMLYALTHLRTDQPRAG